MAFSSVPTVVTNDLWSASNHNTYIRDNFAALWPYTTRGDLAFRDATPVLKRLGIGAAQRILQSSGTEPEWRELVRVAAITSSATPTIDIAACDTFRITALAANITGVTISGTPAHGHRLVVEITSSGNRTIVWGSSFRSTTASALPTTTNSGKLLRIGFIYDSVGAVFDCVAATEVP